MPVNTTGAELKAFYEDDSIWPEGAYHDEVMVSLDGVEMSDFDIELIPSDSKVKILYGYIHSNNLDEESVSFESHFKKWRKNQKTSFLMVKVDNAIKDKVASAIKAAGGVIL